MAKAPQKIVLAGAAVKRRDKLCDLLFGQCGMNVVDGGRCLVGHAPDVGRRVVAGNRRSAAPPYLQTLSRRLS